MGDPFGAVAGIFSSNKQAKATTSAAETEAEAIQYGIDAQLKMWEQAQADFAPYLQGGYEGLQQLQQTMPQYLNTVMAPLYQQLTGYQLTDLPNPQSYTINPVTGQMTSLAQAGAPQTAAATANAGTTQPTGYSGNTYTIPSGYSGTTDRTPISRTSSGTGTTTRTGDAGGRTASVTEAARSPIPATQLSTAAFKPGTTAAANTQLAGISTAPTTQLASAADLSQGGVLAPTTPTLYQDLNYTFNENDPTYQILARQKTEEIDKFLAKQGLLGSSAGEAFRQKQMDSLRAEQDAVQYNRAVSARDYTTQTSADQYAMDAARGETLYNRLYGQASDLYSRTATAATMTDERNLALLAAKYGYGSDIYQKAYAQSTDLANLGAGATAQSASGAVATGQGVAQGAQAMGSAAAQGQLATSQIWANYMSGLSGQSAQANTAAINYLQQMGNSGGYGYYGGAGGAGAAYTPSAYGMDY